ncbi:MAG: NAD(P)-dependent oxidoreductase [Nitrosospira sp.]|nr:NAD(P)-dependent oxidoreductase [Nitrosospira sp.]
MIVAITGGTGFIGKKLVASLVERGDTVRLLTRHSPRAAEKPSLVSMYECDLVTVETNKLSAMLDGADVLYHCAGQLTDPHSMSALHVDATRNLAEAASRQVAHWVQLSSVGVYGPVSEGIISEEAEFNPVGEYEITKTISDQIIADTANRGGFSYSILRPSNVFGAGMTNNSLFSMIAMIDRGLFSYIGKLGASANYIHVNNVVEGLVRCGTMHSAKGRIYNLSDHRTIEHLVEVIAAALGCASPWLRIPKPIAQLIGRTLGRIPGFPLTQSRVDALVNRSHYPISRIQRELGYNHVIAMEDGLRELVEVYRNPDSAS